MAEAHFIYTNEAIGGWPQPIAGFSEAFNRAGRPSAELGRQVGTVLASVIAQKGGFNDETERGVAGIVDNFDAKIYPPQSEEEYAEYAEALYAAAGYEQTSAGGEY